MCRETDADTVSEEANKEIKQIETGWDALTQLIADCQVDAGIEDLAHQHDHYLYGTPKRD